MKEEGPKRVHAPIASSKLKGPRSPLKKQAKLSVAGSETESSDDEVDKATTSKRDLDDAESFAFKTDPERVFISRVALDPRRGIFYDFKWEQHWGNALATFYDFSSSYSNTAGT